jgi:hypothetical protein
MPAGRPRTSTPPPEEMIKLGEEMLEWIKVNKPLHLSEWYSGEMFITSKVWDTMQVAPEFFPYYEKALRMIGKQYLDKTSKVRDSISHRWLRVYFKDLKREEDETAKFNQLLKIEEMEKQPAEVVEKFNELMTLMKSNQERKIDETSNNTESISK